MRKVFNKEFDLAVDLDGEVVSVVNQVVAQREKLDELLEPLLSHWTLARLGCSTHLILRLALWELVHTEVASEIIINEAIELAKCFTEKDAYKFINGVLDKAAKKLRSV